MLKYGKTGQHRAAVVCNNLNGFLCQIKTFYRTKISVFKFGF